MRLDAAANFILYSIVNFVLLKQEREGGGDEGKERGRMGGLEESVKWSCMRSARENGLKGKEGEGNREHLEALGRAVKGMLPRRLHHRGESWEVSKVRAGGENVGEAGEGGEGRGDGKMKEEPNDLADVDARSCCRREEGNA